MSELNSNKGLDSGVGLVPAIRAELRKLTSTKLWWILALLAFGYLAFIGAVMGFSFTADLSGADQGSMPSGRDAALTVLSSPNALGYVFPLVIGSLVVTSEYRHRTLTPTLLAQPDRSVFLGAKLAVALGVGAVYGLAATLGTVVGGAPVLAWQGDGAYLSDTQVLAVLGLSVLVLAIWAVLGAAFGALVTNQVVAIIGILGFTQFVEPVARLALGAVDALAGVSRFLPGAAADAVVGYSFFSGGTGAVELLNRWQGALVLLVYVVVLVGAARLSSLRKDVT